MKKTNEKTIKNKGNNLLFLTIIILLAIIMVSSSLGLYAWAKYQTSSQGTATAQIAKWYFNLKTGEYTQNGPQLLSLTRTDNCEHVAEGKLAPGTSGVLPIIVDTTGTEVDLVYDVTITINNCPQNLVCTPQTPSSTTQTITGEGTAQNPRVRTIRIKKYVPCTTQNANRQHDETITWNWPYETGSGAELITNDEIDTTDAGKQVEVSISAIGTEVLNIPVSTTTITTVIDDNTTTVTNGSTISLKKGDSSIKLNLLSRTEDVTYGSSNSSIASISSSGQITPNAVGTAAITLTGSQTGETVTFNVKVKPQYELSVRDSVTYSPSGTYSIESSLIKSYESGTWNFDSGVGQSYHTENWQVLSADNDTGIIQIVPESSIGIVMGGAMGYSNGVKFLNDLSDALYGVQNDNRISARSISVEDFERLGGERWRECVAQKLSLLEQQHTYNPSDFTDDRIQYPNMYANEYKSVINGVENSTGYHNSEQEEYLQPNSYGAEEGLIRSNSTVLQPYQTAFTIDNSSLNNIFGEDLYHVLNKSNAYVLATRDIDLADSNHYGCDFGLKLAGHDSFGIASFVNQSGYTSGQFYFLPIVTLNSEMLTYDQQTDTYTVNLNQ